MSNNTKSTYEIKTMEYLDVGIDDMIALEDQGLKAARAKGRKDYFDWLEETYPGIKSGESGDLSVARYYGDAKALRALKYDLEYNLKPYTAPPALKTPYPTKQAYPTQPAYPAGKYANPISLGPAQPAQPQAPSAWGPFTTGTQNAKDRTASVDDGAEYAAEFIGYPSGTP